jgi:hypothetical protein
MTGSGGKLIEDVEAFLKRYRAALTDTDFGIEAVGSSQLVSSLRGGRKCRRATEERVRAFMATYEPGPKPRGQRIADLKPRGQHRAELYAKTIMRNAELAREAATFHLTDEAERAKTFIRTKGWHVFDAQITRPEHHGKFFIGPNLYTRDEMIGFARRKGFQ